MAFGLRRAGKRSALGDCGLAAEHRPKCGVFLAHSLQRLVQGTPSRMDGSGGARRWRGESLDVVPDPHNRCAEPVGGAVRRVTVESAGIGESNHGERAMTGPFWLWISIAWPLFGGLAQWILPACDRRLNLFFRTATLPAVIAVVLCPIDIPTSAPFLMLGMTLHLTEVARLFLLFTSLLWMLAGWYAVPYFVGDKRRHSFGGFYFLSYTGNLGVLIVADIPSFYLFFALMTFAAYGLVLHYRTPAAIYAGRVYVVMAILGEVLIFSALLLMSVNSGSLLIREAVAAVPGSVLDPWVIGFVIFGFGVKVGILPMHVWLPLAHPVAPVPASAVLSGSMLKAGLMGWILFLPGGQSAYPAWGALMMILGCFGAFYAVILGCTQSNPKTNLAYSSVSQMAVMTIAIGIGLSNAADWITATWIVGIYALNHAFAKGALFMGIGVVLSEPTSPRFHRYIIVGGLMLAALSIAGSPMTGGALAKRALKYLSEGQHVVMTETLTILLTLSAFATTLLLARLIYLLYQKMIDPNRTPDNQQGLMLPWSIALLAVSGMVWFTILYLHLPVSTAPFTPSDLLKSSLPILAGLVVARLAYQLLRAPKQPVPAGDILLPVAWVSRQLIAAWIRFVANPIEQKDISADSLVRRILPKPSGQRDRVLEADARIRHFEVSGAFLVVLLVIIMLTLAM